MLITKIKVPNLGNLPFRSYDFSNITPENTYIKTNMGDGEGNRVLLGGGIKGGVHVSLAVIWGRYIIPEISGVRAA